MRGPDQHSNTARAAARQDRCVVVGIGAPASGSYLFERFVRAIPSDPGVAFVWIRGHGADRESPDESLPRSLSARASLPVLTAEDDTPIRPNHVYVAPPDAFLRLDQDRLRLDEQVPGNGPRLPIDGFFRSLATERGELAVGILLAGTAGDGTQGLKEIKAQGGMAIVQEPAADTPRMPRAAWGAGAVDLSLPVEKMPDVLLQYARQARMEGGRAVDTFLEQSPDLQRAITDLLYAHTDHDFRSYKKGTLARRVQRRMGLRHVESLPDYVALLREDSGELASLARDVLINVTAFFRDEKAWSVLEEQVVAGIVKDREDGEPIRVWVPGCATGEEAYSIGMLFLEQLEARGSELPLQVFATDLDEEAMRMARLGSYPRSIAADVPPGRLGKFFTVEPGQGYRVRKALRECIVFSRHDLIGDPPLSRLDVISCRNVMIYLEPEVQHRLAEMLHFALRPAGYLFLGRSETIGKAAGRFDTVSKTSRIYRKKSTEKHAGVPFPMLAGGGHAGRGARARRLPDELRAQAGAHRAQQGLLERFAPPSVLIDRDLQVLYFHGELHDFLEIPRGAPTSDLMQMCRGGLRHKLRGVVRRALEGRPARETARAVKRGASRGPVVITATPLPPRGAPEPLILVTFQAPDTPRDAGAAAEGRRESAPSSGEPEGPVESLEVQLQVTREDLRSTTEDLEASNDELRAFSEELVSMNEALQSANEDLESSREELQSLNEELHTVNAQLEEKVRELESTNDDLTNLLTSTELAAVFLDTSFRIRRFTPAATELLHVTATDLGRPIGDLSWRLHDPHLHRDARSVLRKLTPVETRVSFPPEAGPEDAAAEETAPDGGRRWFIRRVLPYRTLDDRIGGVVVTFTDVTDLQRLLGRLARRERQAAAVAQLGRTALSETRLDALFDAAVRLLAETLETELCKVLELQPDGRALLLRSGVGWKEGLVGTATVHAGADSQAGYTLQRKDPVLVEDLREEVRFGAPLLLRDHAVVSGASVVIGPTESPWGVLGTHSKRARKFDVEDAHFLQAIANVLWQAIVRRQRAEAVEDRERRLRLVTDALPVLIAYVDRDLVYRFCNAGYQDWFGLDEDEIIGKSIPEVLGEETFRRVRPHVERVLGGERVSLELRLAYRHGPPRDVRIEYIPHVAGDEVVGYYAMIEDVSDRFVLERAHARLAAIVEQSHDAIIAKDLDGNVTAWNAAAERMYGYTADEMVGQPLTRITPADRRDEVRDVIDRVRNGEAVENRETVRRTRDGRELRVSLTASPLRDAAGELIGVSTIARDMSERVQRELQLRDTTERLLLAKNAAQLGIYDYDVASDTVRWDERVRMLWGGSPEVTVPYEAFLAGIHSEDRSSVERALSKAIDPAGDGHLDAECRLAGGVPGTERWVKIAGVASFDGDDATRIVGAVMDVTERHRYEDFLRAADRRKDEFLATLGHELRNPLGAIVNTVECLRAGAGEENHGRFLDVIARQASHMTSLLNDLLDLGRITRGDVQLRPVREKVADLVERSVDVVRADLERAGHSLVIAIDPPDLAVVVDPVRCEQILVNLLNNAILYTREPGTITVSARESGGMATVAVTDTGIGLTQDEQARVFELFYQARPSGGLGIGLSLVQTLVALHGGTTRVASEGPGRGSTLHVTFPLAPPIPAEAPRGDAADEPGDLTGLRVLIVDDQEDSLRPLELLLSEHCHVRTASTGAAGLEEAQRFRPHVMLLDISLPDMTGYDLAAAISGVPGLEGATRIAVTGFGDSLTADRVREAGFQAHVVKPLEFSRLLALLERVAAEWGIAVGERPAR